MMRGCGWEGLFSALRNSCLAAPASRSAESRKSIVAPAESMARYRWHDSVATLDGRSMGSQELGGETVDAASSGGQFEELVDEPNLTPNISSAHPPNLPLPCQF